MNDLIELITQTLQIPYLTEQDTVYDGSYTLIPYMSTSIKGNGKTVNENDYASVELFYKNKFTALEEVKRLKRTLEDNHYVCENPEIIREDNGDIYRASMNVISIGGQ